MTNNSEASIPDVGKTAIFTNNSGNISTRTAAGDIREYSPTALESESMVYGVKWDSTGNDAMQAGIVLEGSWYATDYSNFPIQEKCIRGLLTDTGAWTELHPYNTEKYPDGTSADITGGSDGQVMVQVPRHYQLVKKIDDDVYFLISEQDFTFSNTSAWVPPAFLDKSHFYIGAFQGVALSDAAGADVGSCTKVTSGYDYATPNPFTDQTIVEFRSQCDHGVFSQMSLGQYDTMYMLALIEFKTFALQEVLEGNTEHGAWDYADTQEAGATTGLGNFSGSIWSEDEEEYIANSYRGVEHIFGNVYIFADGANVDTDDTGSTKQRLYTCYDPDDFTNTEADILTDYTDTGCAPDFDNDDDYIKDVFSEGKYCPLFPVEVGAASDTYITDYLYTVALGSGWRVVVGGGMLNDGRKAGFGCRTLSDASSRDSTYVGVRLGAYV